MLLVISGYIAGILSAISYVPYVRDIFKGITRPERASWLIWSVLGSIAFFSQLAKGATDSLWLTGVQTFGVLLVFLLSIKFGIGGLTKRDVIALIAAGAGIILWYLTKEAAVALFITIAIDAVGGVLTVIKSYEDPSSETISTWLLSGSAGIFAAIAVGKPDVVLLAYPLYILLINFSVVFAIHLGKRKMQHEL